MEPPHAPLPLLAHDFVVLQQRRVLSHVESHWLDPSGTVIATVNGGPHSMLTGTREFYVSDATGPVFHLHDPVDFGLDTFEFYLPDGRMLGQVKQRMSFLRRSFDIVIFDGTRLHLERTSFSRDITFRLGQHVVARAAQHWQGFTEFVMGRDQYGIQIDPGAPPHHRIAMLAALLALDMNEAKELLT